MMQRTDQIDKRKKNVSDAIFMAVKSIKTLFPPFVNTFCFTMNNIFGIMFSQFGVGHLLYLCCSSLVPLLYIICPPVVPLMCFCSASRVPLVPPFFS